MDLNQILTALSNDGKVWKLEEWPNSDGRILTFTRIPWKVNDGILEGGCSCWCPISSLWDKALSWTDAPSAGQALGIDYDLYVDIAWASWGYTGKYKSDLRNQLLQACRIQ